MRVPATRGRVISRRGTRARRVRMAEVPGHSAVSHILTVCTIERLPIAPDAEVSVEECGVELRALPHGQRRGYCASAGTCGSRRDQLRHLAGPRRASIAGTTLLSCPTSILSISLCRADLVIVVAERKHAHPVTDVSSGFAYS